MTPLTRDRVPLDRLKFYPGNARKGDVPGIRASLDEFGQVRPLLVQRSTWHVLVGNNTLEALRLGTETEADVDWIDCDDSTARRIALADNRLSDVATYDDAALAELLRDAGPSLPGWRDDERDRWLKSLLADDDDDTAKRPDREFVPDPPPGEPVTRTGDLWLLGPHRLLCGDATDADDRRRLVGPRTVRAVVTDPPYAIYGSSSGVASDVADDKMVRPFFEQMARAIMSEVAEFGHVYVFTDWRSWSALWEGVRRAGLTPKNMLVWDKGGAGLGNNYANTHELIAFSARLPRTGTMTSGRRAGQRPVLRPNILRYQRARGDDREHNAAKPVDLLRELVRNSTDPGDVVLDLYAGSGSTLIAADAEDRVGLAMEIEPAACDVIVNRWQRITGGTPKREEATSA